MYRYRVSPFGYDDHDLPPALDSEELAIAYAAGIAWSLNTDVNVHCKNWEDSYIATVSVNRSGEHVITLGEPHRKNPAPVLSGKRKMRFRAK